jgi:hypothetical protein
MLSLYNRGRATPKAGKQQEGIAPGTFQRANCRRGAGTVLIGTPPVISFFSVKVVIRQTIP